MNVQSIPSSNEQKSTLDPYHNLPPPGECNPDVNSGRLVNCAAPVSMIDYSHQLVDPVVHKLAGGPGRKKRGGGGYLPVT